MSFNALLATAGQSQERARQALRDAGAARVEEAADGDSAIRQFQQGQFDLVFINWDMQTQNGENAAQRIRQADQNIPIVAFADDEQRQRAGQQFAETVSAFLPTAFNREDLQSTVDRLMGAGAR